MHAPQIIMMILLSLGLLKTLITQDPDDKYVILGISLQVILLYWGGFFTDC
jgi:hypothetical protein